MTDYAEFRIRIERGTRKGQYRVEASGLAGNQTGVFRVPFKDEGLENFVLKVGQTRRGVRSLESPQFDLAKEFGGKLFSAVVHGPVAELYRASFGTAQATGQGTRVTLSLTDVPELAEIPWEYLFDAPNFLAISTSTPVVRYLDVAKPPRPLEVGLPIRILGVVSAPTDYEVLDAEDEKARLTHALKPLIDANAVSIEWLEVATLPALAKKLQPNTFHILHFIGHGGFDRSSGKGALLFEDESGRGRAISGEQLATILHDKQALRLVFLNSCEGARTSIKDPFSGVAASLIEREIPAVIAMQFEITDRAAIIFAGEFYAMLAEGQPVDASVTQARLLVFADDNDVEWGTPVLFLRVSDGRLFEVADASALPRVTPEELPPKVVVARAVDGPAETPDPAPPVVIAGTVIGGVSGDAADGAGSDAPITSPVPAPPGDAGDEAGGDAGSTPPPTDGSPGTPEPLPIVAASGLAEPPAGEPPGPPAGEPPTGEPPGPPASGEPPAGSPPDGPPPPPPPPDGPPPGGSGSGSGGPPTVGPVGPTTVRSGTAVRSIGIAAIAIVAVLAVVFLLGAGRLPWDTPTGSTGLASGSPAASTDLLPTPTPSTGATPGADTPPPDTPPPATPNPSTPAVHIAVEMVDKDQTNSRGIIDGVRLAVKDAGGAVNGLPVTVPASVVFGDNRDPDAGRDIISKVIDDDDVIALVGPYTSDVAAAQIPLSNEAGLLQCSPSATNDRLTKPGAGAAALRASRPDAINFVRTVTTNDTDAIGAAMYLLDSLGRQAVYIVDDGEPYAVSRAVLFRDYWESRGATVVGRETVSERVRDFSTLAEQARASGADVIYFSGSSTDQETPARVLRAMRDAGLDVPFMSSGEILTGPTSDRGSFLSLVPDLAGSGVYTSYPAAGDYEGRATFEARFRETYGRSPGLYAITAYACTQAILDALSRTDLSLDRAALRDAVRASTVDPRITYRTAMGDFRFDENGDTTLQIVTIYDFPDRATAWRPITSLDVPDQ